MLKYVYPFHISFYRYRNTIKIFEDHHWCETMFVCRVIYYTHGNLHSLQTFVSWA